MVSKVNCCAISGIDVIPVSVETDISNGLPAFDMVGLLSSEVREARERVRTAIRNSGFLIPAKRITINLAPANLRKAGTYFDLPIAVSILQSLEIIERDNLNDCIIAGELSLNGDVVKVNGVLPMILMAADKGVKRCIVPMENYGECISVNKVEVIGVRNLNDCVKLAHMSEEEIHKTIILQKKAYIEEDIFETKEYDFANVHGQLQARKGAEIAAAGMHNFLMIGTPGTGKSMIAKAMSTIMPDMSDKEQLEISRIQSIAGILDGRLARTRPFRNPHSITTVAAITGGGMNPHPGEVTLAHGGILYLDELPEFPRGVIESLRQPLEEGRIAISRSGGNYIFPARFSLVAAMNPCKCGFYPDRNKCSCSENDVERYMKKVSGPILDRIDLCTHLQNIEFADMGEEEENSKAIKERVNMAAQIQRERYKGMNINFNGELEGKEIEEFCNLEKKEKQLMEQIYNRFNLSVRAYGKVIKVARTVADLNERKDISTADIATAITFRPPTWMK